MISGFQKMTLLDYPGKVACTVFTSGCNLRCPFCHNARLVTEIKPEENISEEYIFRFLSGRKSILDGVCITGGEPLLYKNIKNFKRELKNMGFAVKLDTNGFFPEPLKELAGERLIDYVAMDVKNSDEKYALTTGIKNVDLAAVNESIHFLIKYMPDFEFRTTVVKEFHTVEDVISIAHKIEGAKKYFLQNFVDSGNLIGENLHAHDVKTLEIMCKEAQKYVPETKLRGV